MGEEFYLKSVAELRDMVATRDKSKPITVAPHKDTAGNQEVSVTGLTNGYDQTFRVTSHVLSDYVKQETAAGRRDQIPKELSAVDKVLSHGQDLQKMGVGATKPAESVSPDSQSAGGAARAKGR